MAARTFQLLAVESQLDVDLVVEDQVGAREDGARRLFHRLLRGLVETLVAGGAGRRRIERVVFSGLVDVVAGIALRVRLAARRQQPVGRPQALQRRLMTGVALDVGLEVLLVAEAQRNDLWRVDHLVALASGGSQGQARSEEQRQHRKNDDPLSGQTQHEVEATVANKPTARRGI